MDFITIADKFKDHFKSIPRIFRAPGRVNLIGEHVDYNDGFVLPIAINNYTAVAMTPRQDRMLWIWSENMKELKKIDLDEISRKQNHWSDYIAGLAKLLELNGIKLTGANLFIESEISIGAGLSSSAALEVSASLALLNSVDVVMDSVKLAKLGQTVENQFVGTNSGIMDPFVSVHGEKDKAIFLDCRSLDYELISIPSDDIKIVICNTKVKHELGESEYNNRRSECEAGVKVLKKSLGKIRALRDVTKDQFNEFQDQLMPNIKMRCRHVISEIERTRLCADALKNNDLVTFGKYMYESHDSLRDDYQVSCRELDVMVNIASKQPGVLGARMTGGGFGGSTVNLVKTQHVGRFCEAIYTNFKKQTGIEPIIYISTAARGAAEFF